MAIDGRDIARPKREKDVYESPGARIAGIAIVAVPLLAIVAGSYWVGEWTGGVVGGVLGVVIDRVGCHDPVTVVIQRFPGIWVDVEFGKIAAGQVHSNAVATLEDV